MRMSINSLQLKYECLGSGETILLLHGWGGSLESLWNLGKLLSKNSFKVYLLDLPGFGKSDKPKKALDLNDYAEVVEKFCQKVGIKRALFFGHSFGGSVALKLAVRKNLSVDKLVICNSSGIRNKRKKYSKRLLNISKKILSLPLIRNIASKIRKCFYYYILKNRDYIDYPDLKGTYKKVIEEDLTGELKGIDVPTLILWGKKDKSTPLQHAHIFHDEIRNSELKVYENEGHGLPKYKPGLIGKDIIKFIRK